jgi:hypothetical protein
MTGDSFYLTFTTLKEVYSCKEIFFENLKGKVVEILAFSTTLRYIIYIIILKRGLLWKIVKNDLSR